MKTWVTSDLHLDHSNIMKYSPTYRQFDNVDHMNSEIIINWNLNVQPDDVVYILGDVAFCEASKAAKFFQQLNGKKILIEGNHDHKLVKNQFFRDQFEEIHKYLEIVYNGHKICMFHYPISEWNQCHRGSIMLHGHLHGNPSGLEHSRVRDVGFDATGNVVSLLDDIVADALQSDIRIHGWR